MSEIRQDPTTKEWVIIAKERAKRSHSAPNRRTSYNLPNILPSCHFCPGNEAMTPPEILSYHRQMTDDWQVRVFANKYPALKDEDQMVEKEEGGLFQSINGVGAHEVIVETPQHNQPLALMDDDEVAMVLCAYRDRYNALSKKPHVKSIVIFKNHGLEAGTSMEHSHSQLIATPVVPRHIKMRVEIALNYYKNTGRCLYSDIAKQEIMIGKRVVMETDKFVVFHPFASKRPFETWIVPKTHQASFGSTSTEDLECLSHVLRIVLLGLYQGLDNPDFNYVVDSAPVGGENDDHYLWHFRIVPRLTETAGFEIGSGMHINTALPEETAHFIRELEIQ